jgi:hypothetical protein
MSRRRASPGRGAVSANVKRVIALGVTQFAAFAAVLTVGWSGGPGHPTPAPTVTVTQTKTEIPRERFSQPVSPNPTPDVRPGQGAQK